ncbi:GFA family protein [Cognatishimia sp. WU-CL00825]|uniref:GFA family protein n=1 Tax=Cognatishimia sp. WU-CL00825 TaxID=3127658 RepID=UPI003101F1E1
MSVTGACLCGAVRYTLKDKPKETGACHCDMCRRWSGGVFMSVKCKAEEVTLDGQKHIGRFKSSDWAERCFCNRCGSVLFYRVTASGPYHDDHHFGFGTLDNPNGIPMTSEIYIDKKPDGFAFKGDHHTMTEAEVIAMFAPKD